MVDMCEIEGHFANFINHFIKNNFENGKAGQVHKPDVIEDLKEIYTFAYQYGDSYTNGEKVNFSEIGSQKREMLSIVHDSYGDEVHQVAVAAFNEAFQRACNHGQDVIKEEPMRNVTYYVYSYEPKWYSMLDWQNKPVECFKDWATMEFSNALKETNKKWVIEKLVREIPDKDKFLEFVQNISWNRRFVQYCYGAFMQALYLYRLPSFYRYSSMDTFKVEKEYKKIIAELEKELNSFSLDQKIIEFHLEFIFQCANKAELISRKEECSVLEMIVNKTSSYNNGNELLKLEMFISANEEG